MSDPLLDNVLLIAKRARPGHEFEVRYDDAGDVMVEMTRPAVYRDAETTIQRDGNRFSLVFVEMRETSPAKTSSAVLERRSMRRADLVGELAHLVVAATDWMWERLEFAEFER